MLLHSPAGPPDDDDELLLDELELLELELEELDDELLDELPARTLIHCSLVPPF